MSMLLGKMQKHLPGMKALTSDKKIIDLNLSKTVYIPLVNGRSVAELLVEVGDHIDIGTKIAEVNDRFYVPIFSSVSGEVKSVKKMLHSSMKMVLHLEVAVAEQQRIDSKIQPLAYEQATKEELIKFTEQAGIVGCGGAGFPTYVKYKFAKDVKYLIINAVECEPYITSDYQQMKLFEDELIVGIKAMLKMSEAKECKIAIKKTKKELIKHLISRLESEATINVAVVDDVYPMGWERTLIYALIGKRYDRLPGEVGCIVNNATTAISLARALQTGLPIVHKIVTISGDGIASANNVKVAVGTPIKDIVNQLGGYTSEDILLIAGGPMMGKTIPNENFCITSATNAITILKNTPVEAISCLRCGRCSDYCPAGLQPVRINQASKIKDIAMLDRLAINECIECGMCTYVCPSKIDVAEGVRKAKQYYALKKK